MKRTIDYKNILQLVEDRANEFSNEPFIWEKSTNGWEATTWKGFVEEAKNFASALLYFGFKPQNAVSILSANRREWPIVDIATIYAGGIASGIYPTSSPEQCEYMINHSESYAIFVDTLDQYTKLEKVQSNLKNKLTIVLDHNFQTKPENFLYRYDDFLKIGKENLGKFESLFANNISDIYTEDIAMYVYTSGTTGDPKAAMLSHRYFLYSADSIQQIFNFSPKEKIISYLPYCHVGERIFGFAVSLGSARQIYHVREFPKLDEYLQEINPDIFGGIPRVYEKMFEKLNKHISQLSMDEKEKIVSAQSIANDYYAKKLNNLQVEEKLEKDFESANTKILKPLRDIIFGKNVRVATSGAAALAPHIAKFFVSIGSPIYEAYGLTENVCGAFNRPNKHRISTVGIPMPHTEIKLAEDGEILMNGRNKFSGYFKNVEATKEIFTDDGWIKTGDIGQFDEDGFLSIIDRKKELIITSTGKNVAPGKIENRIKENVLISQVMLVGDGKSYISALITLNPFEVLRHYTELIEQAGKETYELLKKGIIAGNDIYEKLANSKTIYEKINETINKVNETLNRTEQIKKFIILPFDFSIERNEITPTLKLKRKVISSKYKDIIESLYKE